MQLVSPGVQVTITDESFYASAGPGTVPLIFIATKQDKSTPDGTSVAPGTLKSNAGKLYLVSSQRELLQTFGDPNFNEISGTPQNGYALNEYGLLAAYSYLGLANRAYIVRADVDLSELEPLDSPPVGAPVNGTYWNDLNNLVPGLFEYNGTAWVEKEVIVTDQAIGDLAVQPSAGFSEGDVVLSPDDGFSVVRLLQRVAGVWHEIGTGAWATATGNDFNWAPHTSVPSAPGTGDLWWKTTTPNKGLSLKLKRYDSASGTFIPTNDVAVFESHATYYASPGVNANSVPAGRVVAFTNTAPLSGGTATMELQLHNGQSQVVVTGTNPNPVLGTTPTLTINGISISTLTAGDDIDDVTLKINSTAGIAAANIVASKTASGLLTLTNTSGNDITVVAAGSSSPAAFTFSTNNLRRTIAAQTQAAYDNVAPNGTFAPGLGYAAADVITLSDGTVVTVGGVSTNQIIVAAQDEANYNGVGSNGTFAPGIGYGVGNTLTLTGGHGTITVDAIGLLKRLTAGQTQVNFDNVGTNGTFAPGVGYANGNTITLSDGSLITVNTISALQLFAAGVIDETDLTTFTGGLGYAPADTITVTGGNIFTVDTISALKRLIAGQTATNFDNVGTNGTFAAGSGYAPADTITVTGGNVLTVNTISATKLLIAAQTQANFDGAGSNGTFVGGDGAGGTAYVAADTITLNDGSVITVDSVDANDDVLTFTVTSVGTTGFATGATLTQSSTSGTGTGFTLTTGTANEVNKGDVATFTVTTSGTTGFATASTLVQTATSGTGTGFTLTTDTANEIDKGDVVTFDLTTIGTAGFTSGATLAQTATSGAGTGFTVDSEVAVEVAKGDVVTFTVTTAATAGFTTASTLTQSATSGAGTGFTLTTDTANEIDKGDVTQFSIATVGTVGFATGTLVATGVTGGTGSGFTLTVGTANEEPKGDINAFTVTTAGSGVAPSLTRTQSSVAPVGGTGFTLTTGTANELNVSGVSAVNIVNGGAGFLAAGSFNITVASDSGYVAGTTATINYTLTGDVITGVAIATAGAGYTPSLSSVAVATADEPVASGSSNGWSTVGLPGGTYSNFSDIDNVVVAYQSSFAEPSTAPADGTLWYSTVVGVDLMYNDGAGAWRELDVELYVQPAEPTAGLSAGDLWLDTDQLDAYPVIYRRNATNNGWDLIDNTDQTTPAGIIFADARADAPAVVTPGADATSTLDADAPDPLLYPVGMLLWNSRASTRNVKVYRENYTFEGVEIGDRWVTASGNRVDGSPYMGQDAVKQVIIEAIGAELIGGEEIRSDTIFYNLIAAPGFPELIDEMLTLNTDRKETAFIIGDTPFHLASDSTSLQAWATNANGAASNGDDGLLTSNPYLGVYYPSGLSTNVDGSEVVVPASHMMLRTMAYNDQVSYPWFAPAGFARGTINNAVSVGYLNDEDEFVPVTLNQGQRDVLYTNNVNPIAFIPGRGLVVYGQKTRNPVASAMDRVNVVRLINYIRFQAEQLAQPFLFEPNDSITRGAVKGQFDTFLAELITLRGLYDFLVVCDESNNTPARIDRNELWVDIAIQPVKAVEFIYIPIRIRNTGENLSI